MRSLRLIQTQHSGEMQLESGFSEKRPPSRNQDNFNKRGPTVSLIRAEFSRMLLDLLIMFWLATTLLVAVTVAHDMTFGF